MGAAGRPAQGRYFGPAGAAVEQHPHDRLVAAACERVIFGADPQQSPDLVVAQHRRQLLPDDRWLHPLHRRGLDHLLLDRPFEERLETAVAVVRGRGPVTSKLVGDEGLDVLATDS